MSGQKVSMCSLTAGDVYSVPGKTEMIKVLANNSALFLDIKDGRPRSVRSYRMTTKYQDGEIHEFAYEPDMQVLLWLGTEYADPIGHFTQNGIVLKKRSHP